MTAWLARLFGRQPSSAQVAKNRLKLVLSYDRTNLTPELLSLLQDEIVKAISAHLEIDRTGMTISTQRGNGGDHIVADIPIRGLRPARRLSEPATVPPPAQRPQSKKHKRRH